MKKGIYAGIAVFVLAVAAALWAGNLRSQKESGENAQEQMQESGGNQEEPIVLEDGYHQRDNMCNVSFPIWSTERDGIRYGFDQNGFTKEEATDYVREMGQSVAVIREKMIDTGVFMRDTECQVLVLNDSPATAISASKEVLVLDKNSLEKEDYKFPLFLCICRLPENSQSFGACEYIFGSAYSNDKIKEYLAEGDYAQVLNLFYPRTSELYSDKENAEMFRQILASLATETIQEKGMDAYLEEPVTGETVNGWLEKIGAEQRYDGDNVDFMAQMECYRDSTHDFHIICGNVTYLFRGCESVWESVSEMEDLIVWEKKTREAMETYLENNHAVSPLSGSALRLEYEFIGDEPGRSYTRSQDQSVSIKIYDISRETVTHELAHAFTGVVEEGKAWMNEGIAEYFSMSLFPDPSRREAFYQGVRSDVPDTGDSSVDNYVKMEGMPKTAEDLNMSSLMEACIFSYWNGEQAWQVPIMTTSVGERNSISKSATGAELNYWEAESFVSYLAELDSFESVWDCMVNDRDFEEIYGKTYHILKKEWMRDLKKKFE